MAKRVTRTVSVSGRVDGDGNAPDKPLSLEAQERERKRQLLDLAQRQFDAIVTGEGRLRRDMLDDRKFRVGQLGDKKFQWPEGVQQKREAKKRPCEQVNRIPGFVALNVNAFRDANLRIFVKPVDDTDDPKVAEVLQSLIRNAENVSSADRAYITAAEAQVEMGRGFFRLRTEWADETSFRQRVVIDSVLNPFRVYTDLACEKFDYGDAGHQFYVTDIDDDTYKTQFRKEPPKANAFTHLGDRTGQWFPSKGKVRIVEWFNVEHGPEEKLLLFPGEVVLKEAEVRDAVTAALAEQAAAGQAVDRSDAGVDAAVTTFMATKLMERVVRKKVIKWRKIDVEHIHEESEWPASGMPFIPMLGDVTDIDGEKDLRGVVRDSKGPQRIYNVMTTGKIEMVGIGPKAPFIGLKGQFGKPGTAQRRAWDTANEEMHAFLEADAINLGGTFYTALPQRNFGEPPIGAINDAIVQADTDLKSTARYRDASLAERGPQESGKAILARQRQDELSNSHYMNNGRFALRAAGLQMIQLFRVVMTKAQVVRVTGKDDKERKVLAFSGAENDPRLQQNFAKDKTGKTIPFVLPKGVAEGDIFDIGVGNFDVEVTAAPDPGTRRQEELEIMLEVLKLLPPEIAPKFIDLFFLLIDSPIGRQLSERAKKEIGVGADEDEQNAPVPPKVAAELNALRMQHEQLMAALDEAQEAIRTKRLDLASKENIELMRTYVKLLELFVREGNEDRRLELQLRIDQVNTMMRAGQQRLDVIEARAAEQPDPAAQIPGTAA